MKSFATSILAAASIAQAHVHMLNRAPDDVEVVTITRIEIESTSVPASTSVAPSTSSSSALVSSSSSEAATSSSASPSASATGGTAASLTGSSNSSSSSSSLTPNGRKAGLSGYPGIQSVSAFQEFAPYISWYSDYDPNTPDASGVKGIGMLWGADGSSCGQVETDRLATFNAMLANGTAPGIMFGFYEPDCQCPSSSDMSTAAAAQDWDSLLAPLKSKGTVLGSPSMCKQYDEDFLTPFKGAITGSSWDVTSIHINKPNVSEAQKDVEYYASTYGRPIWVSEFACVHDQPSWQPCTDQTEIDGFISDVVKYFESSGDVVAYGPSNGEGLGDVWPLTDSNGDLTPSGQTYLNVIKAL